MVIDPQMHRRPTRRSFPTVVQTMLTAEIGRFSRLKMTQDSPSSAAGQEPTQLTNPVPCPQPASQPSPASMDHHARAELSQGSFRDSKNPPASSQVAQAIPVEGASQSHPVLTQPAAAPLTKRLAGHTMQNLPGPTLSLGLLCPLPAPSMVAATGRRPHPSARLHVAGLSQPASRTWWASHMPSTTSDIQSQGGFAQQWNWSPGPSLYVTGSLTGQQDLPIER